VSNNQPVNLHTYHIQGLATVGAAINQGGIEVFGIFGGLQFGLDL